MANKVQTFYAALGRFLVAWADLEFGLDLLVLKMRLIDDPQHRAKRIPHQLADKLKFAKHKAEALAVLTPHREVIETLINEVTALADTRHDYVHGAVIEHRIGKVSVTATMGRLLQPANRERRHPVRVTTALVSRTADEVFELADREFELLERLAEIRELR